MTAGRSIAMRDLAMALAIIAIALFGHAAYIHAVQPDVPYMDSLRMLVYQQEWRDGKRSLFGIWEMGSNHHGLVAPTLLWANVSFFGLDARLANYATGWVIAAICAIASYAFLADRQAATTTGAAPRMLPSVIGVGLIALLFFSLAGYQLMTLELGLALWVKNLLFVVYFLAHQAWLRKPAPDAATGLLLAVFGAAIVLLAGMGWSYGFAGAVIGTQVLTMLGGRRDRGAAALLRWVPAIALVLALIVYALLGRDRGQSALAPTAASTALLPLYSLGSAWSGAVVFAKPSVAASAFFVAGIVSVLAGSWALYRRWRRGMLSGSLLPVYFLGYGAACALLFSLARGAWGVQGVIAPRYYMDVLFFPVGLLWLLFEDAQARRDGASRFSGVMCIAFAAVLFVGHAWTYRLEWHAAPWRELAFDGAEQAVLRGGTTKEDARSMQAPLFVAKQAVAIMRARKLSVFRDADVTTCDATTVRWTDGWHPLARNNNRWMAQAASIEIPPCSCDAKAKVYLPAEFAARDLVVAANGAKQTLALAPGKEAWVTVPAAPKRHIAALSVSVATLPTRDMPGSKDTRTLGALFGPVRFDCTVPAAAP